MCAQRRVANHYHLSVSTRAAVWLSGVGLARDPHDMLHILYSKVCVTTQVTALCIYIRIEDRYNAHRAARKANIERRLSLLWVGISDISQTHLVICVLFRVSQTPKPRTFAYNIYSAQSLREWARWVCLAVFINTAYSTMCCRMSRENAS